MISPALLLNVARLWREGDASDVVQQALASGFDGVGLVDSPRLFPDGWVETERVLSGTTASLAGPCVTSLGLRHPATVAGAVRTLEGHHPGRLFTVVGRGESSVRNEGLNVPSMGDYTAALEVLGELLTVDGQLVAARRVLGAASGPRTITATASALGGVLIDVGVDAEVVGRAVALARRDEPTTAVWLFVRTVVTSSDDEAVAAAEPLLGSCAGRLATSPQWYGVDASQVDSLRAVAQSHDYRRHGTGAARGGARSDVDKLVREKFALTGSEAEIAARARDWSRLDVDGVVIAGALPGVLTCLPELAAALREGLQ